MLQIPPELQARYNALLAEKAIPDKYQKLLQCLLVESHHLWWWMKASNYNLIQYPLLANHRLWRWCLTLSGYDIICEICRPLLFIVTRHRPQRHSQKGTLLARLLYIKP